MFSRLKETLKRASQALASSVKDTIAYKELRDSDVGPVLEEVMLDLVESDVALEAAEEIVRSVRDKLVGVKVPRAAAVEEVVKEALKSSILEVLAGAGQSIDLVQLAREACSRGQPLVILFLGVNGTGKTTTIAKVAKMLKDSGITPVIAAADTFRAGAQEQLSIHAERIGVPIVKGRYGSDPASVAFDAIKHAKSKGLCVVLVDTAGRMHVDSNLVEELRKIVRVVEPDLKVLVVDSLTGNDAVEQARSFDEAVGVDAVIVTKVDADPKGGTLVSVAHAIRKPVIYIGVGQDYSDLEKFDPKRLAAELIS
ncbi:MAG: signal recognition particle-docking protein FtsY [Aeropyrum sp.]|nr:signal recognition particle-docking protein FtsY [Aeropyrum sp.]MCE4616048.1 signal recognition particle-docking protein FtsY [Aeropyrum sp.]